MLIAPFALVACEPLEPILVVQAAPVQAYVQPAGALACNTTSIQTSCAEVHRACELAGFYPGGVGVGKGIKVNCLEELMRGVDIASVSMSVRPEEINCINAAWANARQQSEGDANDFENNCIYTEPTSSKQAACDDVVRACAAGGYYVGGMDVGRGVLVDCLDPLRHGKRVARVNVDPWTLHGCFGPNLDDAEGDRMASDRASVLAPAPTHLPRRR